VKRIPKLEIVGNSKGRQRWWVRLVGGNGEIMWATEKFASLSKAKRSWHAHADLYRNCSVAFEGIERRI
jgi:uncharacterized protein YegP (UPF0339 family)